MHIDITIRNWNTKRKAINKREASISVHATKLQRPIFDMVKKGQSSVYIKNGFPKEGQRDTYLNSSDLSTKFPHWKVDNIVSLYNEK